MSDRFLSDITLEYVSTRLKKNKSYLYNQHLTRSLFLSTDYSSNLILLLLICRLFGVLWFSLNFHEDVTFNILKCEHVIMC